MIISQTSFNTGFIPESCQIRQRIRVHLILSSFLILFCISVQGQTRKIKRHATFSADTSKIHLLIKKAEESIMNGQMDAAMSLARHTLTLSGKTGYRKGIGICLNLKGRILYRKTNYDSSIFFSKKALILAKDLNDSALQSSAYINLGNCYFTKGDDIIAMDYYFKGLAIEEKIHEQSIFLYVFLNNLAGIFMNQKNYTKALEYYLKSKKVAEKTSNIKHLGTVYHNLGGLYIKLNDYKEARICFEKSHQLAKKTNDNYTFNLYPGNMAELYQQLKQYDKAYYYAVQSLNILKKQNYKDQVIGALMTLSDIQFNRNNYKEAESILKEALQRSKEIDTKQITKDIYQQMADLYEKKGNYKLAYDYFKLFSSIKDTLLNQENSKLITEMNTKYTTEKKENEIELLRKNEVIQNLELVKKENELGRQRTISLSVFIGFLLLLVVAVLTFSRYQLKKKANDQLQKTFTLIEEKNSLIEKSNHLITDSITYAKRIQDAILPSQEEMGKLFSNNFFVIYKPSQIVSGDFYWCSAQGDKIIFIVADCTGHGVPGAFMSMIGNTLLNEIVNEQKITRTDEIAFLLDSKIIHALHQNEGSEKYDGMDISICCIDKKNKKIAFTGAHHSLYIYDNELHKIKGDPYSIGGAQHQNQKTFTSQLVDYKTNLTLYFFTDGYCDQSGGSENKRFASRRLEPLLAEIQGMQMVDQKKQLEQSFEDWKKNTKQRDDVLVVGIKC